jgi:hypothetical protein
MTAASHPHENQDSGKRDARLACHSHASSKHAARRTARRHDEQPSRPKSRAASAWTSFARLVKGSNKRRRAIIIRQHNLPPFLMLLMPLLLLPASSSLLSTDLPQARRDDRRCSPSHFWEAHLPLVPDFEWGSRGRDQRALPDTERETENPWEGTRRSVLLLMKDSNGTQGSVVSLPLCE